MASTTMLHTVEALHSIFFRYGPPDQRVSDNGPQLRSDNFAQFLRRHGIKHILSAPYHPSSNGLADRFVQTFKRAMQAGEIYHSANGWPSYCFPTPHTTSDALPGELFLQRKLQTKVDLLKPDQERLVTSRQAAQKIRLTSIHSGVSPLGQQIWLLLAPLQVGPWHHCVTIGASNLPS